MAVKGLLTKHQHTLEVDRLETSGTTTATNNLQADHDDATNPPTQTIFLRNAMDQHVLLLLNALKATGMVRATIPEILLWNTAKSENRNK